MNRRWLIGLLPDPVDVRRQLGLASTESTGFQGWLSRTLHHPALWCPTRRSIAGGVAVGLFVGWLPMPFQMALAAILASLLHVHVPVSVVMVWFTNPLTAAPLLYAAWRTGSNLLGVPVHDVAASAGSNVESLFIHLQHAWPAVLVGCLFWGAVSAVVGFFLTRLAWRVAATHRWRNRRGNSDPERPLLPELAVGLKFAARQPQNAIHSRCQSGVMGDE